MFPIPFYLLPGLSGCSVPEAVKNGEDNPTLVVSLGTQPSSYAAVLANQTPDVARAQLTTRPNVFIVRNAESGRLQPEPAFFERWKVENGGRDLRVFLKEGVLWESGKLEVTAQDLATTVDFYFDDASSLAWSQSAQAGSIRSYLNPKEPVTVISSHELVFHFAKPSYEYAMVMALVGLKALPLERLSADDLVAYHEHADNLNDTFSYGPYDFRGLDRNGNVPYDTSLGWEKSHPFLFRRTPKNLTRSEQIEMPRRSSERLDVILQASLDELEGFRASGSDVEIRAIPLVYREGLYFNTQEAPLDDPRVRRALLMLLDWQNEVVSPLFRGSGLDPLDFSPVTSFFPDDVCPQINDGISPLMHNVSEAEALLRESGWSKVNGYWEKDGEPLALNILYRTEDSQREKIYTFLKDAYKKHGITVEPQVLESNAVSSRLHEGDFQAVLMALSAMELELNAEHKVSSRGGFNPMRVHDPEIDRLTAAAKEAASLEETCSLLGQASALYAAYHSAAYLYRYPYVVVHRPEVQIDLSDGVEAGYGLPIQDIPLWRFK